MAQELREYQREAHFSLMEVARRAQARANRAHASSSSARDYRSCEAERCLCVQPTGAGKTVLVLALARSVRRLWGWRCLIIVPSRELVDQTARRAEEFLPGARMGRITGGRCETEGCDLVIATAASLHRRRLARVARDHFQLVVIDEAHHAAATTFTTILEHFSWARLIVGMTATYLRGDGTSVASESFFPSVVAYHTIGQLTGAGYLVPARGFYAQTNLSLDGVRVSRGQFDERQLSARVNTPERNNLAVDAWLAYARGRQTVVFCVDVEHARAMADCFSRRGIKAAAVWGDMPRGERDSTIADYARGHLQVLVNVKLLIEGWDAPETSAVLIARPATRAAQAVLGPQMIGRRSVRRPHLVSAMRSSSSFVISNSKRKDARKATPVRNLIRALFWQGLKV